MFFCPTFGGHITFGRLQLKSVQTTRVVCTNFSRSLYRLRRGFEFRKRRLRFNCVCIEVQLFLNFDVVSLCLFDIFLRGMTLFATFVPINKKNR